MRKREPLAIIGIGCKYPGDVNSPEEFWKFLIEKGDGMGDIPADRWDKDAFYASEFRRAGKINVTRGGFIKDIDKFDAGFFGISPMEASRMDPQQRIILEVTYEAIQDAGLRLNDLDGSKTAVMIGISAHDYGDIANTPVERVNIGAHTNQGIAMCICANRVSYCLNLRSLSFAVDTACSSSLYAVHLACRAIWDGDAEMAIAGGVNAILKSEPEMGFSKGGFLSPDGNCFSFDDRGNGYIRSEGAGIIIIKPLSQAEKDGDPIYALIRGSAVNQDGATKGMALPNPLAQQELLVDAYKDAGIDPHEVNYVEAHGTGTFVGDPIESNSIGKVIGGEGRKDFCIMGSVKSNIGHLEPGSGIAGISKLALALKNETIPPNIHFLKANPNIAFDDLKLKVPTESIPWVENGTPRYGGVNSFGFGGSNAHIVLEGYKSKEKPVLECGPRICTLSARHPNALKMQAASYISYLNDDKNKADFNNICYSSSVRNSHHDLRLAVVADSKKELAKHLQVFLDGETMTEISEGRANEIKDKIVFIFSGQGPQWWGMGRQLFETEQVFRDTITKLDKMLSVHTGGWSLMKELSRDGASSRISETRIAQPAIFAIQIGLYEMWKQLGITPGAVVGHSIGEVAAGYVSGALTLEQAVLLIFHRSRVQHKATDKGKMLAVGVTLAEAQELIKGRESQVSIGAVNGPSMITLSGDTDVITEIAEELNAKDTFHRLLEVNVPFHSHHMEPLKDELLESLGEFKTKETTIPFYSTVEGRIVEGKDLTPAYWFRNVREPVYFTAAIEAQISDGFDTFIELGPHPIHAIGINDILAIRKKKGIVLPSIRRKEIEKRTFLSSVAALHVWGCKINWKAIYSEDNTFIKLPRYPWQRESFWLETEEGKKTRLGVIEHHPHLMSQTSSPRENNNIIWDVQLDKRIYPYIDDHKVQGPIIYPGAGHIDLTIGAAIASFGEKFECLEDISFENALFLPDSGEPPHIKIDISHDGGDYFVYSKPRHKDSQWTLNSRGKMNHTGEKFSSIPVDLADVRKRITIPVPVKPMHDELLESGLYLGPSFRAIKKLWRSNGQWESVAEIEVHESIKSEFFQFNIHPGVLDSCFQTVFGIFNERDDVNKKMGVYVPRHIDKVKFYTKPNSYKLIVHGKLREWTEEYALGELWIFNEDGSLVAEFHGFKSQYLKGSRGESGTEQEKWFYEYNWKLKPRTDQELFRNPAGYLASVDSIKPAVKETIGEIIHRPEQDEYYKQYEPEQYALTMAYICNALKELGLSFTVGTKISVDDLAKEMGVVPEHLRLFHHMFNLIKVAGFVKGENGKFEVIKTPDFRDVREWMRNLEKQFPQFHHESILLGRCGPHIYGVLKGTIDPIQLIFPEDEWDAIVKYYVEGFAFKKYNDMAGRVVSELLKNLPADQTLRILEIGAGTGGMTQAILPLLPADRTEYVFSDISHMFLLKAQQSFAAYPFVKYNLLDIENDPIEQGFDLNSFDLIIASDVLHATRNLKNTLGNVQKVLASEGVLMLLEVTNSPVYLDFIFGMTEGWWLFEDLDVRPAHATMNPENWRKVLASNNFSDVTLFSDFEKNDEHCQSIIVSRGQKLDLSVNEKENTSKTMPADWLVFADDKGIAVKISEHLTSLNKVCTLVKKGKGLKRLSDFLYEADVLKQNGADQLIDLVSEKENFQGIIYCWGLDNPDNDHITEGTLIRSEDQASIMLMNIMRKLNQTNYTNKPSIWILSEGVQVVGGSPKTLNLSQTGLRGVGRVVINEFPLFRTSLVDFSTPVLNEEIDMFIEELFCEDIDDEIAFRGKRRFINRLERISLSKIASLAKKTFPAEGSPYVATMSEYGVLDNLTWRETEKRMPADDEVEIMVKASALNFRDIMIAMGLLSDAAVEGGLFGRNFGLECSGIITRKGKDAKGLKVGDEVIAVAPACLAGYTYPKSCHVVKKPTSISWQEAASLPVVYTTAFFSLVYHCRLEKGEKILIHAAAGGVGIAAIHMALAIGAEVFATVGSPDKRAYVESLGVKPENIMNSRTLEFADQILEKTNGRGVDVVLNSLSGEAIYRSIQCLAPYGRFVEIGKTDIYRNSKLGLQPFGNNLSYIAVDVDRLFKQKEKFSGKLLKDSIDVFVKNNFSAHPAKVFPVSELTDAFQYMAGARHIGKIIISNEGEVQVAPPKTIEFKENATYLITGGASGFGLSIANWMTGKGARHLVLMSRSGPKSDVEQSIIDRMKSRGIDVMVAKGDVSIKQDVQRILSEVKKTMPPVKGIMHAAMVIDDGSMPEITRDRYMKVFKPKAIGLWHLHKASLSMKLDHFVSFSSISSIYGNPGQVSYVGANSFLDNFASYRRSLGLPGMTINWGVIGDVGFVARSGNVGGLLFKQGWKTFSLPQALGVLEQMLLNNPVQRVATDSDWEIIGEFFPHSAKSSRFGHLIKEKELGGSDAGVGTGDGALKSLLLAALPENQTEILVLQLKETFARVIGTTANKVDIAEPVTKYGLDSLMANQIRNWIQNNLSVDYSMMRIMRGPTIEEMAGQILAEFTGQDDASGLVLEEKSELDKWVIRTKKVENPRLRLFCFPYFAGGASIFSSWHELLPADIEVCAIQFPGREERGNEKPFDDVFELVKKLSDVIEPLLTSNFAFYSHSSGGGIAFELLRYLRKTKEVGPVKFFIGGWRAPHLVSAFKFLDGIADEEVYKEKNIINIKNHLRFLEIPESVIENKEVFDEMLPVLRADIVLGKRYKFYEDAPMDCPLTAFAGMDDTVFSDEDIKAWKKHTSSEFNFKKISGGHLFCRDNKDELLEIITLELS
jgi:acyl transferase domain-containing protein/NADPH:quinone reductase-like Zn-dependent oxidoreductase/surfactin synthase thioesterase subunit/NADP-dependent 3-hydroxy acid dehydrogenase YdfG